MNIIPKKLHPIHFENKTLRATCFSKLIHINFKICQKRQINFEPVKAFHEQEVVFYFSDQEYAQYDRKPNNNTILLYCHHVTRIKVSNYKWTLLLHGNPTTLKNTFNNNKAILESLKTIVTPQKGTQLLFNSIFRQSIVRIKSAYPYIRRVKNLNQG